MQVTTLSKFRTNINHLPIQIWHPAPQEVCSWKSERRWLAGVVMSHR